MATRTTVKPYDVTGPPSLQQQENMDEMFRLLFEGQAVSTVAIASGSGGGGTVTGAAGSEPQIQYNDGGAFAASSGLYWVENIRSLQLFGASGSGGIGFNPQNGSYQDILFGGSYDQTTRDYIPQLDNFSYLWSQPGQDRFGFEMVYDETPDVAAAFTKGIGFQICSPNGVLPRTMGLYQYGGLGTGAVTGLLLTVQNNDSGNGAAGALGLYDKDDVPGYVWKDAAGTFRFHTAPPTESGSVADTVTPACSVATKNLFAAGYAELAEMTAPGAGGANTVRLYAEDDGAGKTRLMAVFNTGAVVQIAIQP